MSRTDRIGSDFAYPDDDVIRRPPRHVDSLGQLVRSGRQGLALTAQALSHRRRVHLPEFHCESMVEPFVVEGYDLRFYALDDDLWPDPDALLELDDAVVLFAPYFGREVPGTVIAAVEVLAARESTPLVVDETHSLFDKPLPANVRVASLRKLLPLGEGGYVVGLDDIGPLPQRRNSSYGRREEAMRLRAAGAQHFDESRALFHVAEEELEGQGEPQGADPRMVHLLRALDLRELAARRQANARTLAASLETAALGTAIRPLTGYGQGATPAYLTCITPRPRELQAALAQQHIYCPVHWPRSGYGAPSRWRSDLISFPVDHRYGVSSMDRVADEVARHLRS